MVNAISDAELQDKTVDVYERPTRSHPPKCKRRSLLVIVGAFGAPKML